MRPRRLEADPEVLGMLLVAGAENKNSSDLPILTPEQEAEALAAVRMNVVSSNYNMSRSGGMPGGTAMEVGSTPRPVKGITYL